MDPALRKAFMDTLFEPPRRKPYTPPSLARSSEETSARMPT